MQNVRRSTGRARRAKKEFQFKSRDGGPRNYNKYSTRLRMYDLPPIEEVSLENFERYAVDRLKVLKSIETAKVRWPKRGEEFEKTLRNVLKENLPLSARGDIDEIYDERMKDHLSHFILRLAYCKSEDLRRWFLTQECELFRYRFEGTATEDVNEFLHMHDMKYEPISMDTKRSLAPKLVASGFKLTEQSVMSMDYFQVDFEEALDLVKGRKIYIEKGFGFIPRNELLSIIVGNFRARLSAALTATSKALPQLEEDDRLLPMLSNLSKQYLGTDYGEKRGTGHVSIADLPRLAEESFPLCMRHSYDHIIENHHSKHGTRQQFGLFLKGIGLSLEDALLFWRTEFSKKMGVDKFDKQYAYNIRHNYGKEGKRTDYTPYSCMKIIMSNPPNQGDSHGCPFRHFDMDSLKLRLLQYKVPPKGITEITQLVQNQHYQVACVKYFEITHGKEVPDLALQHPNQYFKESRQILGDPDSQQTQQSGESQKTSSSESGGGLVGATQEKSQTKPSQDEEDAMKEMDGLDLEQFME
eukprot:m.339743 g.339743  ORF g.339743 m.339743 type:complete len:526 (-) comp18947_c0_seq1:193-1770(-)